MQLNNQNYSESKGFFIALEGMDGCGKSTIAAKLADYYQLKGHDVVQTHEVGGTPIGKALRQLCFSKNEEEIVDIRARLLMVMASRIQHIRNVIKPALEAGKIVISDRYNISTVVYQGQVDGLSETIEELNILQDDLGLNLPPHAYVFIDVDPEVAYRRGKSRTEVDNDQYKAGLDQALKIDAAYRRVFNQEAFRVKASCVKYDNNQDHDFIGFAKFAEHLLFLQSVGDSRQEFHVPIF